MSRAFRDTFKQTFGFECYKVNQRESSTSFVNLSLIKNRRKQLSASFVQEQGSNYKYSDDQRTSIVLSDVHLQKKKSSPEIINHSLMTTPLLKDNHTNEFTLKS